MKKVSFFWIKIFVIMLLIVNVVNANSVISKDGYYNDIRLAGKVKIVERNGDIKVKVVNSFPDIKVKIVENFPNRIGEWQIVENWQDFTIQFVENYPDIKIKFVSTFPGI